MYKTDIVIPVYEGLAETRSCIESVLASVNFTDARIVLVNDCSPNPAITQLLREYERDHDQLVLLENESNLGFVATANRGMAYDSSRDVLLLNSDVEVAGNWLERLREAAYHHEKVASLTPFSNNATIFSFPNLCKDNRLLFDLPLATIDSWFAENQSVDDVFEVPTGVGCCMFIRRDCLEDVGLLDEETFGRGYGEENDWCQRAAAAGWKNYHLANCFVYHKGGVSFAEEQNPRVEEALKTLDQRYPRYHADIQRYIASDPAVAIRTRALLALFAAQQLPKVIFVSHKLGGGAQQHVDELATLYAGQALFLQITPDEEGRTISLSMFCAGERLQDGLQFDVEGEYDKLVSLLKDLGVGHVHFHHTMGLHPRIWVLAQALGCSHDLTVHDYYLINGNPTLTDNAARYVGEESADFDQRCGEHYPLPEGVSAAAWRQNQKLLVEGAQRVIFPSRDCADRFTRYFDVSTPVVAYHPDYQASQPYPEPVPLSHNNRALRVLVVGAISREKGADVLDAVAEELARENIEFHLLGYAYRGLGKQVDTHGPYDNNRVYELIAAIEPDIVWFPALWPETYSYTLSIALHMGLPVVVPDIGAFSERVSGRPQSVICPWNKNTAQWGEFWQGVLECGKLPEQGPNGSMANTQDAEFYRGAYLQTVQAVAGELGVDTWSAMANNLHLGTVELSARERLLGRIWRLSRRPVVAKILSVVPFRVQQAFKRRLSSKPMHDIVR